MARPIGLDFIEGVLGVVLLTYNNVDLGKTIDEASIEFIEDIKDINFAQDGTQPFDKIPTGQAYQVTVQIGELTWARLSQLMRGITVGGSGHSALLGRDIYRSGRDNFSFPLVVTRADSEGVREVDPFYSLTFYNAFPMPTGAMGAFGADNQRGMEVNFYCFYNETNEAFGYAGYASSLGV